MTKPAPTKRPRLAILVNIVAPYRIPIYERIGEVFDTTIIYSGREGNREAWEGTLLGLKNCRSKQAKGWTRVKERPSEQGSIDHQHLHVDPGMFYDLVRLRPKAVITNELGFRTLCGLTYGSLFRKPVFVWWGGTRHTERNVGPRKHRLRLRMARRIKHWISYGETSTEYLLDLGVDRSRIVQIQNCVDERLFQREGSRKFEIEPKPVLLYVGQLIRRKGLDRLLEASAALQKEGREFSLLMVGSGPERNELQAMAEQLGLRNTEFAGSIPASELPGVYRSADILVFPTLEDVWGLIANEAILCGRPVLVSKYAGCAPEIVAPENVFDPLDPDDFVRAIRQALDGRLAPADPSRLLTVSEVSDRIIEAVRAQIG